MHKNNFNLIRFVLASLVIVSHAPEIQFGNRDQEILTRIFGTISFGELAVDGFFVLSGFLISKSWQKNPDALLFLKNRFLRIFPGFFVATVISLLVVGPTISDLEYFKNIKWKEYFVGLLLFKFSGAPLALANSQSPLLNGSLWTIQHEFRCYILTMVAGLAGLLRRQYFLALTWCLFFTAYVLIHTGQWSANESIKTMIRFAMLFNAGVWFQATNIHLRGKMFAQLCASVALLGLLFVPFLAEPAVCTLGGYLGLKYAVEGRMFLQFNRLPDISYGIYLYAWPINKVLLFVWPDVNVYLAMCIVFAFSVVAGSVSWRFVEKPALGFKTMN